MSDVAQGRGEARAGAGTSSQSSSGEEPGSGPGFVPLDRSPGFWAIVGYAVVIGLVLAFAALAFLGLLKGGTKLWFTLPKNPGWFSGHLWWVAVTAAAGVLVGVLRRVFRLPVKLAGTLKEIRDERVETSTVAKAVAVSLVSLVGGASLGPEDALGKMGGGLGTWVSARRNLDQSTSATNTLSGMSAAYGGLLSSPILATALVAEVARPKFGCHAGRGPAVLDGGVRDVLPDRGGHLSGDLPAAAFQVRGLAAGRGRSPRPGRRGARADHRGGHRAAHQTHRSARQADDPSPGAGGNRIRTGRRGPAADHVHRNRHAHDHHPRRSRARRGADHRGRIREDLHVCPLRGHRVHRRTHPRDAVHRRHGRDRNPLADPGAPRRARVRHNVRRHSRSARCGPVLTDRPGRPHHPDRDAAARARGHRGPHGLPRRLGLRSAHGPGAKGTQTRPASLASSRTVLRKRLVTL